MSDSTPSEATLPDHQPWNIGTGVAGYYWPAQNARGAVLLQHGLSEYAHRYVQHYCGLIPALLAAGINVYAFDLRGHGESPGRRGLVDVEQAVTDHLAARRLLTTEQALPLFLFGHSLGGLITASSVVREQKDVRGVILSAPALHIDTHPLARAVASALGALLPTLPTYRSPGQEVSRITAEVDAFEQDPLRYPGRLLLGTAANILHAAEFNWPHYQDWAPPTLVLHGTADRYTDAEGSRQFIELIAAQDKQLHLVDEGYHELLNDIGREQHLQHILEWLEQRMPDRRES
jgi:acylglycerol lipase